VSHTICVPWVGFGLGNNRYHKTGTTDLVGGYVTNNWVNGFVKLLFTLEDSFFFFFFFFFLILKFLINF
jgi:hypothetical protein